MPSRDTVQTLILDTAPLLTSPLASLLSLAQRFVTTADVLDEVRNKGQRERVEREWGTIQAVAGSSAVASGSGTNGQEGETRDWSGLQVREPSADGTAKSTLASPLEGLPI